MNLSYLKEQVDALNYLVSRGQAISEKDYQVINTFKDDMGHLNEYYKFEAMNKNFEAPVEQEQESLIYLAPSAAAAANVKTTPTDHTRSRNRSKSAKRSTKSELPMDERSFRSTSLDTSQVFYYVIIKCIFKTRHQYYNDDIYKGTKYNNDEFSS